MHQKSIPLLKKAGIFSLACGVQLYILKGLFESNKTTKKTKIITAEQENNFDTLADLKDRFPPVPGC
jgi:hypothetical protein